MYHTPTIVDFRRHLTAITQEAKRSANDRYQELLGKYSAKGLGGNFLRDVANRFDELHVEAIHTAMRLIHEHAIRTQLTPNELANTARVELQNLGAELIG